MSENKQGNRIRTIFLFLLLAAVIAIVVKCEYELKKYSKTHKSYNEEMRERRKQAEALLPEVLRTRYGLEEGSYTTKEIACTYKDFASPGQGKTWRISTGEESFCVFISEYGEAYSDRDYDECVRRITEEIGQEIENRELFRGNEYSFTVSVEYEHDHMGDDPSLRKMLPADRPAVEAQWGTGFSGNTHAKITFVARYYCEKSNQLSKFSIADFADRFPSFVSLTFFRFDKDPTIWVERFTYVSSAKDRKYVNMMGEPTWEYSHDLRE
ncbi:MAG: hypothetical protein IJM57_00425 [Lachnospiraceae bacterium]|nr:hypothetical protein [Lachnospiraceae bacterium]